MNLIKNSTRCTTTIALFLIFIMGAFSLASIREDAVTTDEAPHITSGYSYLKYQDMRLNPEHPPLIKDFAALPLLFMDLNFPADHPSWTSMVNAQWDAGPQFLYRSGNNPDSIIFWGRMGPIIATLLFAWLLFVWARELFGKRWALLSLALFAFSPTILAHGRLVTTDVPAAFAFFFAIYYYLKLLKKPSRKNLLMAGIAFALAQLIKFSLVLLVGFLPGITLIWVAINVLHRRKMRSESTNRHTNDTNTNTTTARYKHANSSIRGIRMLFAYLGRFMAILAITAIIIFPIYQFHVLNYPAEKHATDIQHILQNNTKFPLLTDALVWMTDKPILQSYAQYFLGVSMVFMRVAGGNTTYFLGEVSNQSWMHYFPVAFLLKVPLALIVLLFTTFFVALRRLLRNFNFRELPSQIRDNFDEIAMLLFVLFYWFISITGNLNIGVRHVLPTFPFIYLLVVGQLRRWLGEVRHGRASSPLAYARQLAGIYSARIGKVIFIAVMLIWYIVSSITIYPHFLAYFNELAGGADNGYKYIVDSNLDWGQDLRRLTKFVEQKNIDSIKVDYFGGGDVKYYLGDKATLWHADGGPTTGWLAVSATFMQTSRAYPWASYEWLDQYEPIEKIGYSIFVYNIP